MNPADFDPKIAYGRKRRSRGRFGFLPHDRAVEFWSWLEEVRCEELTRHLVMLVVLTAKRTGEARRAVVPHHRARPVDHAARADEDGPRAPCASGRGARGLLRNTRTLTGDETHLFVKSRNRSGVIRENAALNLVKRFDPTITGHGFQATFRTWTRLQKRYERDAYEFALAHGLLPLDEAYMRGPLRRARGPDAGLGRLRHGGAGMPRDLVAVADNEAEDCSP